MALHHRGSNGMFFVNVWVAPKNDRAYLVVTNRADPAARSAVDSVLAALLTAYR